MREPRERLLDILEAIGHVERYAVRGRGEFEASELIQSWFVRHLQIIGEAARALPPEVKDLAPEIAWNEIVGMRHVLVHDYFGVDTRMVWGVVDKELPELKRRIEGLLRMLG